MDSRSFVIIAVLVAALTLGCTAAKPSQQATDSANVAFDRIMQSINTGSFSDYETNFSDPMLSASNESNFDSLRANIADQFGNYQSRSPDPQTSVSGGYNIFLYDCQFEKGRHSVRLVMDPTNTTLVQGLWFQDMKA